MKTMTDATKIIFESCDKSITEQARHAFFTGNNFLRGHHTRVLVFNTDKRYLYFHNTLIAKFIDRDLFLNCVDFEKVSWFDETKDMLNSILEHINEPLIYEEDGEFFWKGGEEFKQGWNKV